MVVTKCSLDRGELLPAPCKRTDLGCFCGLGVCLTPLALHVLEGHLEQIASQRKRQCMGPFKKAAELFPQREETK